MITGIADRGGLDDHVTAHVLRHSFATTLVRGGTDLVIAAELLGHRIAPPGPPQVGNSRDHIWGILAILDI